MANGEYAIQTIQALWPYTKGGKGPSAQEWSLVARDVDAAGLDQAQLKAIIEEMKREDQYFRITNLSKRLRAVTGKTKANGEASNWKKEQGDRWRARADRLRRVWAHWASGPDDPMLEEKARLIFGNLGRMADSMLPTAWPHDAQLTDEDLLRLALGHVRAAPEPRRRPNEYPPPPWQPLDVQADPAQPFQV